MAGIQVAWLVLVYRLVSVVLAVKLASVSNLALMLEVVLIVVELVSPVESVVLVELVYLLSFLLLFSLPFLFPFRPVEMSMEPVDWADLVDQSVDLEQPLVRAEVLRVPFWVVEFSVNFVHRGWKYSAAVFRRYLVF